MWKTQSQKEIRMEFVQALQETGNEILAKYTEKKQKSREELTELEKQVLGVYLFGMADGLRIEKFANLSPVEVETAMIAVIMTVWGYTFLPAQKFVGNILANVQTGEPENTIYALVHRGLDGYFAWEKGEKDEVIADLESIFEILS